MAHDDEYDPLAALRLVCLEQLSEYDTSDEAARIVAATEPLSREQQESIVQRLLGETRCHQAAPPLVAMRARPSASSTRRARAVTAWSVAAACVLCWASLRLPQHGATDGAGEADSRHTVSLRAGDPAPTAALEPAKLTPAAVAPSHVEAARLTELAASCARAGKLAEADALYFRAFEIDPPPAVF